MDFFEEAPEPEVEDEGRFRQPDWMGPPDNMVGGTVPLDLVLANTGDVAVVLGGFTAYPTGVTIVVHLLWRHHADDDRRDVFMAMHRPGPDAFRFGVELPDGRRAFADHGEREDGPTLMSRGGGGGGLHYQMDFWLWPLPPDGSLRLACEWPAHGIPESVVEVDAAPFRDAATRAIELWPDDRPVDDDEW